MTQSLARRVVVASGGLVLAGGAVVGVWWPHASALLTPLDGDYFGYGAASLILTTALGYGAYKALGGWLRARLRTASTVGVVAGTSERQSPGHAGAVSRLVVRVEYQVARRRFTLEWVPSHIQTSFRWLLDWLARRYPSGKELALRYDPKNPSNATVGRSLGAPLLALGALVVFWAGLFLAIVEITGPLLQVLVADDTLAHMRAEAAETMDFNPLPCTCTPAGGASQQPLQLAVALRAGRAAQTFDTHFRLRVAPTSAFSLPVRATTAPGVTITERLVEAALACTSESLLVAQADRVTAWSLHEPRELWTTRLNQKIDLDPGAPAEAGFSLVCRELAMLDGVVRIPVGNGASILVRAKDGGIVSGNDHAAAAPK